MSSRAVTTEALISNLTGKIALITGSTDGVGRFVARKLGQGGAEIIVHGRDADRGAEVVSEITAGGGKAQFFAADLSSLDAVRSLADAVLQRTAQLDLLINNAGIGSGGPGARRGRSMPQAAKCASPSIISPASC